MNVALVNLPNPKRIMRRWIASYNAPNFLMPPTELMSVGACLKNAGAHVILIDCIAEGIGREALLSRLAAFHPDLVISLVGFKVFPDDMAELNAIKNALPDAVVACFGYLPSQFPKDVLKNTRVDAVVIGEPEHTLAELYERLAARATLEGIAGLAFRHGESATVNGPRERIADLDSLPFPDVSLIDLELYNESFLDKPIGCVLSARGCPFQCTYCVRTYGRKIVYRSAESVLVELRYLHDHGITNVRFLDDTFTLDEARLRAICEGIIRDMSGLRWTCLSRVDTVTEGSLALMRAAGCVRIYVGLESGSQRVLNYYRKGCCLDAVRSQMETIRKSGIEVSAFFLVGALEETEDDLDASIQFAKRVGCEYVIPIMLQYWPGTELFERERERIEFSLFPYVNRVKDEALRNRPMRWEKEFYRRFYLRPSYVVRRLGTLLSTPKDVIEGYRKLRAFIRHEDANDDFI